MKETTVAIGRGIIVCLMSMMVICLIQMQKLQAFFVLEVHVTRKYCIKPNSPVTDEWILEHVVPHIANLTYSVMDANRILLKVNILCVL